MPQNSTKLRKSAPLKLRRGHIIPPKLKPKLGCRVYLLEQVCVEGEKEQRCARDPQHRVTTDPQHLVEILDAQVQVIC
jgi:hypothetical protein